MHMCIHVHTKGPHVFAHAYTHGSFLGKPNIGVKCLPSALYFSEAGSSH